MGLLRTLAAMDLSWGRFMPESLSHPFIHLQLIKPLPHPRMLGTVFSHIVSRHTGNGAP